MALGPWTLTDKSRTNLATNGLRPSTAVYKLALFLSTSNIGAASTTYAGVTNEHANANGYVTGGISVTLALTGTTAVTVTFADVPEIVASGGNIVARWAVLYEVGADVLAYSLLDPVNKTVVPGIPFEITTTDVLVLT